MTADGVIRGGKMQKRATIGLAVLLLGLTAAGVVRATRGGPDLEGVRLAVFRHQVAFWLDDLSRASRMVVCLSTEEDGETRSVPDAYLSQFAGEAAVRSGSACDQRPEGAVERATGRPAVLLTVGESSWRSADEVWVTTRYYRSALISGSRTQRVVREGTGWACLGQIIKDTPL